MFPPVSFSGPMGEHRALFAPYFQVTGIPKFAAEDTSLVTTDSEGRKVTVPVPQGTPIVLNVPGLHNNRS